MFTDAEWRWYYKVQYQKKSLIQLICHFMLNNVSTPNCLFNRNSYCKTWRILLWFHNYLFLRGKKYAICQNAKFHQNSTRNPVEWKNCNEIRSRIQNAGLKKTQIRSGLCFLIIHLYCKILFWSLNRCRHRLTSVWR